MHNVPIVQSFNRNARQVILPTQFPENQPYINSVLLRDSNQISLFIRDISKTDRIFLTLIPTKRTDEFGLNLEYFQKEDVLKFHVVSNFFVTTDKDSRKRKSSSGAGLSAIYWNSLPRTTGNFQRQSSFSAFAPTFSFYTPHDQFSSTISARSPFDTDRETDHTPTSNLPSHTSF